MHSSKRPGAGGGPAAPSRSQTSLRLIARRRYFIGSRTCGSQPPGRGSIALASRFLEGANLTDVFVGQIASPTLTRESPYSFAIESLTARIQRPQSVPIDAMIMILSVFAAISLIFSLGFVIGALWATGGISVQSPR